MPCAAFLQPVGEEIQVVVVEDALGIEDLLAHPASVPLPAPPCHRISRAPKSHSSTERQRMLDGLTVHLAGP